MESKRERGYRGWPGSNGLSPGPPIRGAVGGDFGSVDDIGRGSVGGRARSSGLGCRDVRWSLVGPVRLVVGFEVGSAARRFGRIGSSRRLPRATPVAGAR